MRQLLLVAVVLGFIGNVGCSQQATGPVADSNKPILEKGEKPGKAPKLPPLPKKGGS